MTSHANIFTTYLTEFGIYQEIRTRTDQIWRDLLYYHKLIFFFYIFNVHFTLFILYLIFLIFDQQEKLDEFCYLLGLYLAEGVLQTPDTVLPVYKNMIEDMGGELSYSFTKGSTNYFRIKFAIA